MARWMFTEFAKYLCAAKAKRILGLGVGPHGPPRSTLRGGANKQRTAAEQTNKTNKALRQKVGRHRNEKPQPAWIWPGLSSVLTAVPTRGLDIQAECSARVNVAAGRATPPRWTSIEKAPAMGTGAKDRTSSLAYYRPMLGGNQRPQTVTTPLSLRSSHRPARHPKQWSKPQQAPDIRVFAVLSYKPPHR